MPKQLRFEPAVIVALVESFLVLVGAFGLSLDGGQIAAVVTFLNVLLAAFVVRPATVTKAALNELEALPADELAALKAAA